MVTEGSNAVTWSLRKHNFCPPKCVTWTPKIRYNTPKMGYVDFKHATVIQEVKKYKVIFRNLNTL